MSNNINDILRKLNKITESISSEQQNVGQLSADFTPNTIKALGSDTDPQHPAAGKLVGETAAGPEGYQYEPRELEDSDGFSKIAHYFVAPSGKEVMADFNSYSEMDEEDIKNWFALGMPKRKGLGPWDKKTLQQAVASKGSSNNQPNSLYSKLAELDNKKSLREGASIEDISDAIMHRLLRPQNNSILSSYTPDEIEAAVYDVASFYEGAEELGTSDVSIMVREVIKSLQHQSAHSVSEDRATLRKPPRKGTLRYEIEQRRKKYDSSPERQKEIDAIGNQNHYFGNAKVIHKEVEESAAANLSVFNQLVQMRRDKTGGDLTIGNETMPIQYAHVNRLLQVYRMLQIRSGAEDALKRLSDYSFVESVLDEFDRAAKTSAARSSVPGQRAADNYDTPAAARATQGLNEAIKLGSRVVMHDPGKDYDGKVGYVGEIRRGPHKTANKTYTVDYEDNGRSLSVQLDKKKIKQATSEAVDPAAKIEAKIEKLKKQRESVRDRIGLAKEKRRAKGQRGVQGDAEIKLARKADDLSTQITQLEQELDGLKKVNEAATPSHGMIRFVLDTERAYEQIMDKFGHVIDHDENDYLVVPAKYWPQVEELGLAADGIGPERVDESIAVKKKFKQSKNC